MGIHVIKLLFFGVLLMSPCFFTPSAFAENEAPALSGAAESKEAERLNKEALVLAGRGDLREAVAIWERAAKLENEARPGSPTHVEMLNNLGLAYFKMGNQYFPLAEAHLNRAVEVDPNNAATYLNLGDLCYYSFLVECAIGNYEVFLKINPQYVHADTLKKRIERLVQKTNDAANDENEVLLFQKKYVYRASINDDLPVHNYYVTINKESFLSRVDILRDGEAEIHQTIRYEDGDFECEQPYGDYQLIEVRDYNGDGYGDLKVACTGGGGSRTGYLYYLYDKRRLMFVPFIGGTLPGATKVNGTQEIRTYSNCGKSGQRYVENVYKMSERKLSLIKEVKQDQMEFRGGKKYYKKIIRELKEGRMVAVSETFVEAKDE